MHQETLPDASHDLLASLTIHGGTELSGWILAGGTGLALQLGHRVSDDFDFFRTHGMNAASLFRKLAAVGTCETLQSGECTLSVLLSGVRLSFFQIDDPFHAEAEPMPRMLQPFDWVECKAFFVREARTLVLP